MTSRTIVPIPLWMWVVHGMQGSNDRTARITSMPLSSSSSTVSRRGVPIRASSYGPGFPNGSRGAAFQVEGVQIW